jgi:hypothetical protein
MQLDGTIFRAMLHCPYKAWQLLKEENREPDTAIPVNKLTQQDKTAIAA